MTFRANRGVGRHGWLRLTPAYGVRLVRDRLAGLPAGSVVTDPFSGTGTTPLAAAELGLRGQSVDLNPFLIWLGTVKTAHYPPTVLTSAADAARAVLVDGSRRPEGDDLWKPPLFQIEKWWSPGALHALTALRHAIDQHDGSVRDLLEIGLCRTLIACSNAAFNHQSMSFKRCPDPPAPFDVDDARRTFMAFTSAMEAILDSAREALPGSAVVRLGDSRAAVADLAMADLVLTSPPYVNRMSYIRELRPYMYWLRHLDQAADAGVLDWQAIGGTWGTATSNLTSWTPEVATPVDAPVALLCDRIRTDGGRNGPLLATYVHKYHHDMWQHFRAITPRVRSGGRVAYIIGNSTFYGHEVPVHEWYAAMLRALGYLEVGIETIRKRNSNKALFEYEVTGVRP